MHLPCSFKNDLPKISLISLIAILFFALAPPISYPWSEKAHTYIAAKAGIKNPDFANLPDLIREDNYHLYAPLHMHYAAPDLKVTPEYIEKFKIETIRYKLISGMEVRLRVPDSAGVLYWEICNLYNKVSEARGWRYRYYLFNIAHFIADLSQPLHNYPWGTLPAADGRVYREAGAWSKDHHRAFDKILDKWLPPDTETEEMLKGELQEFHVESEADLKREICRIANSSIGLANRCYAENRQMTKEEAVRQISMSISLIKAVMAAARGNQVQLFEPPN